MNEIMTAQNLAKAIKQITEQIKGDLEEDIFEDPALHNIVFGYQKALEAALTASGIEHG